MTEPLHVVVMGVAGCGKSAVGSRVGQQLGLRLQPTRGPVDVILIDGVERPSPN